MAVSSKRIARRRKPTRPNPTRAITPQVSAAQDHVPDPTHRRATAADLEAAPQNTVAPPDPDHTRAQSPQDPHDLRHLHVDIETAPRNNRPTRKEPQLENTPTTIGIATNHPHEAAVVVDHTPKAVTPRDLAPHHHDPGPARPDHAPVDPDPKQCPLAATPNPLTRPDRGPDLPDHLASPAPTHPDPRDTRQDPTLRDTKDQAIVSVTMETESQHAAPETQLPLLKNRPIQLDTESLVDLPGKDLPVVDLVHLEALPDPLYLDHGQDLIADADEPPSAATITETSPSRHRLAVLERSALLRMLVHPHQIRLIQHLPCISRPLFHLRDDK